MAVPETHNLIKLVEYDHSISHLPQSAREIFSVLRKNGALKSQEIGIFTTLSHYIIRYILKILIDKEFIHRVPDLHDLRSYFYTVN